MTSTQGFPDWQETVQWLGAPLASATGLALGAGTHTDGPFPLDSWASVIVAIKPTGGNVTVKVQQSLSNGPASLVDETDVVVPAGQAVFESVVLFGNVVTLVLEGAAAGVAVDYAIYPANTTTNAQVLASAVLAFLHNGAAVAQEAGLDLEDADANVWTVTDDPTNNRVRVSPLRRIFGRVNSDGSIASGSGFGVSKTGTGTYVVTYDVAFVNEPHVGANIVGSGTSLSVGIPTTTSFGITTLAFSGGTIVAFNAAFTFEVTGT